MTLYLLNGTRIPVEFKSEGAAAPSYPALRGSRVLSYGTDTLQLTVKELATELFTLRYNWFRFFKNQALEAISPERGMRSRVMLQGDLHASMEGIGTIHQLQDSVSLTWSEKAHCKAHFEGGKAYASLDIFVAPRLVEQLAFLFPKADLNEALAGGRSLLPHPCFVTPRVRDVLTHILECPYDEATSRFYFDLKVKEYLYVLLEQQAQVPPSKYPFTAYEVEQIQKARALLLSRLDRPPLTIRELARGVGLNEFKLKAGFKQFFDTGVFECFQQARMEKARHLLLHTDKPIKDICQQAGYPRMTNFITAFRKHFGYTPASLRRNG
jgi:AraC-like DNA-binding protein